MGRLFWNTGILYHLKFVISFLQSHVGGGFKGPMEDMASMFWCECCLQIMLPLGQLRGFLVFRGIEEEIVA